MLSKELTPLPRAVQRVPSHFAILLAAGAARDREAAARVERRPAAVVVHRQRMNFIVRARASLRTLAASSARRCSPA